MWVLLIEYSATAREKQQVLHNSRRCYQDCMHTDLVRRGYPSLPSPPLMTAIVRYTAFDMVCSPLLQCLEQLSILTFRNSR